MRWSPIVVASLFSLVSWTAEAHPAPVSYSNSTARSLHKRSIVCGINLRTATADDCLTKHSVVNFKLSGTGTRIQVTKEAVAANAVAAPAGSACGENPMRRRWQ
ncbi:hypothetical protein SISNIDRAFT_450388 [Sistotremastrum niveocremeum HHB9708]|uniref:Uncharacterized protein n=2 Tax=Sistotremastraceae TaxID=3402574 RepID=A0A164Y8B3_9AGAM|nr:hypothetical protein SISNIDRAFT_450388 [Sistotremastrum niveocremeum HHB9708]KZT42372.1 hypothetical protein SISSUDRAFT_1041688 [Sistotremastrum suecicum HHB10207 ss-3]